MAVLCCAATLTAQAQDTPALEEAQAAPTEAPAAEQPAEEAPAEEAKEAAAEEAPAPEHRNALTGSFDTGVDAEWSDDDSDIDLHQTLRLRWKPAQYPNWSAAASLWMSEDVGSEQARSSALRDIDDAYNGDVRARLFELYAQRSNLWGSATLRVGRQRISDSPWYSRIDGLYLKNYCDKWEWYLFAGARASVYEDAHDDLMLGGGAAYRITPKTKLGVDFLYADDHRHLSFSERFYNPVAAAVRPGYPNRVNSEVSDTQVAFSAWHDFTPNVRLFGRFMLNDGDGDELLLDLTGYYEGWDLTYEIAYRHQLQRVADRVNDISAFYRILGPENEYGDLLVSLHKPLTPKLTLSLEGEWHDAKADDELSGNRDYWRVATIVSVDELAKGLDASLSLERWDSEDGDDFWTLTGELRKEIEKLELFLGADYERYRDEFVDYNPYPSLLYRNGTILSGGFPRRITPLVWSVDTVELRTREDIYSVYTGFDWELCEKQSIRGKITFEEDEGPDSPYWRVQAGYEIRF